MRTKYLAFLLLAVAALGCKDLPFLSRGGGNASNANTAASQSTPEPSATPTATPAAVDDRKDLLALGNGSFVISQTSEFSGGWRAINLLDELPKVGWATEKEKTTNNSIVIELGAKTSFKTFVFDTAQVEQDPGRAAKDISIEISDTSATDGFQEVLSATLKDKTDGQELAVSKSIAGRWLRLNIKNNYGSPDYTDIMELRGYGDQEAPAILQNVSGTYDSDYGKFHIKQDGTTIVGCYEYNSGLINGGVDGRLMKLIWSEGEKHDHKGPAMMFFSQDGKTFLGVWAGGDSNGGFPGNWNGKKISDKVGNCPHLKDLDGAHAAQDQIENSLEASGRAIVYGINFDFNSDKIKEESLPTLDQIAAVLKDKKDWKMTVEGHTDNVGGEAFNQSLSERRAKAVKDYLEAKGIEDGRLKSTGLGMSKPVASNDTEAGRAQNRRVELVKN